MCERGCYCCSVAELCPTLQPPWSAACQAFLSFFFTLIKRLFSSSSLSAIRWCHLHMWGCRYSSWQSWFQLVLHPAQHFAQGILLFLWSNGCWQLGHWFSAFSKSSLLIWKFFVHVPLNDFEHYLANMWNECNCVVVWTFFGIALLWDWNENWLFPVLWQLLTFPDLLTYECSTLKWSEVKWSRSIMSDSLQPLGL